MITKQKKNLILKDEIKKIIDWKKIKEEKNRAKQNTIPMNNDLWGEVQ
jgi:hypothetical protein